VDSPGPLEADHDSRQGWILTWEGVHLMSIIFLLIFSDEFCNI
jgi:hypothetical protein